ncbi:MAG: hypothetical protein JWQ48_1185 [Conexibacter sp.]|nr:hypothetical protein [Conexibacter sp.]
MSERPPRSRLELPGVGELAVLYPDLCYAAVETVAATPAAAFAGAVLAAWPATTTDRDLPVASLIVSRERPDRFSPELSIREPFELQVWAGGAVSFEIEFAGRDVAGTGPEWEEMRTALSEWAQARGTRLVGVHNDRGRSLSDVWNARFAVPRGETPIGELAELARRAIRVAELRASAILTVTDLLGLLRAGEGAALVGLRESATLLLRGVPSLAGERERWQLASDVAALANGSQGGLVLHGVATREEGGVPTATGVEPFDAAGRGAALEHVLARLVYPPPDGLRIEPLALADAAAQGLLAIVVPAQDRILKPFLVHGALLDDRIDGRFVSLVERRDADTHVDGIAALHAAIAAGRALLRGPDQAITTTDPSPTRDPEHDPD